MDNLITWQETHSLSRIPREDCHETGSLAERGWEQSQLIPRMGFREDFLVGTSSYAGDDDSTGIVILNRRQRWVFLHRAVLTPKDMERWRDKDDVNGTTGSEGKGHVLRWQGELSSSPAFSACCVHSRIRHDFLQKKQTPGFCLRCQQGVCRVRVSAPLSCLLTRSACLVGASFGPVPVKWVLFEGRKPPLSCISHLISCSLSNVAPVRKYQCFLLEAAMLQHFLLCRLPPLLWGPVLASVVGGRSQPWSQVHLEVTP